LRSRYGKKSRNGIDDPHASEAPHRIMHVPHALDSAIRAAIDHVDRCADPDGLIPD
jgi:hypothetical protein